MSSNARALSKLVVGGEVQAGGTEVYATVGDLPLSGNNAGDTAFVTENNRMYIWNGNGWFSVALINTSPTITNAPNSVYNLNADGTPTIITLAATDPEGFPLTWSHTANDATGKATITNVDNVFTITPLTNIADTSFIIDFNVTDGVNVSTASSTINIENRDPIIDTPSLANYALATDGTPTVITLAATDPDGQAITWSYNATGLTNQATITQSGSEFTITPTTNADEYSDFTIEFVASDSIESSSSTSSFSLTFMLLSPLWKDADLSIGTSATNGLDNSTFIDRSTNNSTTTNFGVLAQSAFHPYLDYWSVEFDGTNDYFTMPDSDDFHVGQSDFTIDFWLNKQTTSTYQHILRQRASGTNEWCIILDYSGTGGDHFEDGALWFEWGSAKLGWDDAGIPNNEWCHVAVTRSGTTGTLYVNGVSQGTRAMSDITNVAATMYIGAIEGFTTWRLKGYLSNLRIVKGTVVYPSAFTPPTEPSTAISGTSLLTCQSNRFIDNSSSAHAITASGDPVVSASNPFGQESEYAVGENKGSLEMTSEGYIRVSTGYNFGSFWTLQMWYKFNGKETGVPIPGNHYLYDVRTSGSGYAYRTSATNYSFGGSSGNIGLTDSNFNDGQWHHLAVVMENGNNGVFLDGVRLGTPVTTTLNDYIYLNSRYSNQYKADISIADLRITNTADFSGVASTCPVPTSPLGINANTKAYFPFDNAGIFDKTGNHTLTPAGNASTSTTQTKYADTAMYFDGTGDYLTIPDSSLFAFGSGDFTIECWVYKNASNAYMTLGGNASTGTESNKYQLVSSADGTKIGFYMIGNFRVVSTSTIPTSTWTHVAYVRSSGVLYIYINGVQEDSAATTENLDFGKFWVGQIPALISGRDWNGYIENLQILKGVAKYTANFTVPDREQGRKYQAES